eukprot:TRINITY_DN1262_c0_g3_i3.p1 TRINITY_DN1262_c0_g3~~TRINITY_DN1262_c0_g3_i3.p1  ORF type:complete len:349 (-),score=87.63 TRINITY_DN1262_c0_g3_i3:93-1139(-)
MYRTRSRERSGKVKSKKNSPNTPKDLLSDNDLWTEREERLLYEAIEEPEADKCWEDIIDRIRREIPDFNYKPEACMRRYKHFINPSWHSEHWAVDQGFFLSLLAHVHGYRWPKLSALLQQKHPSTLKNYFYSYFRKAVKHAGAGYIPLAVLYKAANFFEWMQVLEEIRVRCFRGEGEVNEKVAEWIAEAQLDSVKLKAYRDVVVKRFREVQGEEKLPITLMVDMDKAKVKDVDTQALIDAEESFSTLTKDLVAIRLQSSDKKKLPTKSESFKFPIYRSMLPVHVFRRTFLSGGFQDPLAYPNVPEYLPPVGFAPQSVQSGIIIQQPQEAVYEQKNQKSMNNGDNSKAV